MSRKNGGQLAANEDRQDQQRQGHRFRADQNDLPQRAWVALRLAL